MKESKFSTNEKIGNTKDIKKTHGQILSMLL